MNEKIYTSINQFGSLFLDITFCRNDSAHSKSPANNMKQIYFFTTVKHTVLIKISSPSHNSNRYHDT